MERMSEGRLAKKVWKAEVSGVRPRGRPWFGWMDGMKKALSKRGLTLDDGMVQAVDRHGWRRIVNG